MPSSIKIQPWFERAWRDLTPEQTARLTALHRALVNAAVTQTVTIAYSGGLDSRFLAFVAKGLGWDVRLLHIAGNHIGLQQTQEAVALARAMGMTAEVVHVAGATPEQLAAAGKERCYVCKKMLFAQLKALAREGKLCDGSNASDARVFRPGARAVSELGVLSPLADCGWEKHDIRAAALQLGLPAAQQAARPCLLTRFPYGVAPSQEQLQTIAQVEAWLAQRAPTRRLRVRLRYPEAKQPQLHVERSSLPDRDNEAAFLEDVRQTLQEAFAPRLVGLTVRALDQLSGFYDRAL